METRQDFGVKGGGCFYSVIQSCIYKLYIKMPKAYKQKKSKPLPGDAGVAKITNKAARKN